MDSDMEKLTEQEIRDTKRLLAESESLYKPSSYALFDPLFDRGEVKIFSRQEVIMQPGKQLRDVYIVIDGLVGSTYVSGNKVIMHGLATPGTMLLHGGSFFQVRPSFMQWEALVTTKTLRIPDSVIRDYLMSDHEFAIWMYGMAENYILYSEEKTFILSDRAEQRYLKLVKNLPRRVFRELPSRVVARYLGITEQSLSRIKRSILKNGQED